MLWKFAGCVKKLWYCDGFIFYVLLNISLFFFAWFSAVLNLSNRLMPSHIRKSWLIHIEFSFLFCWSNFIHRLRLWRGGGRRPRPSWWCVLISRAMKLLWWGNNKGPRYLCRYVDKIRALDPLMSLHNWVPCSRPMSLWPCTCPRCDPKKIYRSACTSGLLHVHRTTADVR